MPKDSRKICPFLDNPSEECHVAILTSGAVEKAILYCGGEYERCEIYRRIAMERRQESRRPMIKPAGNLLNGEGGFREES